MQDNDTIREQMDACRPGKLDEMCPEMSHLAAALENDAELRQTFALSQQVDQRLQDAYQDVVVPAGLADRLLASLEAADEETPCADLPQNFPTSTAVEAANPSPSEAFGGARRPRRGLSSRRNLLWGASTLVAASLICATMYYNNVFTPKLTVREVCELTPKWLGQLPADSWQSENLEALLAEVPAASTWLGGAIIISSTLYIAVREARLRAAPSA